MKKILLISITFFIVVSGFIGATKKNEQPNILFIEVDDLTAKYLGCFGAEFAKTPNVDALAQKGVLFENNVCQGTMCGPSRNSLITGLYPHNLGFYENKELKALPKDVWTFPKALQGEGYETFWVGKCHIRPNTKGIQANNPSERKDLAMQQEMGFDHVYQSAGRVVVLKTAKKQMAKGKEWKEGKDAYGDFLFKNGLLNKFIKETDSETPTTLDPDTEYMDGHFTTTAIEQMKAYQGKDPFFMWVNFSTPHGPFDVPQKYHDMFKPEDMPEIIDPASEQFEVPDKLKHKINKKGKKGTAKMRAQYAATIAYMDAQVGRLVDFVNTSKFSENTVIVFFSDHGLMTGDHGLVHKTTLYKEVLNTSLIISYPKEYEAKSVAEPTELLDLGKTVLDIAGATGEAQNNCPNGYSLLPFLNNQKTYQRPNAVFSEVEGYHSVFDGRYKYIHNPKLPILFDLEKNPEETINYADTNPEKVGEMVQMFNDWVLESGDIRPSKNREALDKKKMEKKALRKKMNKEKRKKERQAAKGK